MYFDAIYLAAIGGKLSVESTSLDRSIKEGIKLGFDLFADKARRTQISQQNNFSVMGFSLNDIYTIKIAAQKHNLNRVVIFPCPVNGLFISCIKMEGGDIPAFCQTLGQTLLDKSAINADEATQEQLIEQYGVILYQKKTM